MAVLPAAPAKDVHSLAILQLGYIVRVSGVAALGGFLFGFDTAIVSGAIPYLQRYFHLNQAALGGAVSSILIGCGAGALLAGPLAEARGRRWVLLACALLFALSGLGAALAQNLSAFVLLRLVGGLGVGAAALVSPMYIAEMAPAQWRGRLVSLYQLAIVLGVLLAYCANYGLAGMGANNWRWMFASQVAPALLFGSLLLLVPETPRWLAKQGRLAEARQVLDRTGGAAFGQHELEAIQQSFRQESASEWRELVSRRYRPVVLLGISLAVFQQVTGINAILYYAPIIFRQTGLATVDSLRQTIGIGAANVVAALVAIGLVDKVGRRRLLLVGSVLMGLSLVVVAACFTTHYFAHYVVVLAMLVYVGAFGATLGAVTWVYLAEVFPNRIRGLALAAATLLLWLADFIVAYAFPVMVERLGTAATLLTYAGFCGLAFVYVLAKVPETKGKSLEQIEQTFLP